MKVICPKCNGRLMLETYNITCKSCQETGATVCGNCLVSFEWNCINCGNVINEKPVRRNNLGKRLSVPPTTGGSRG